MGSLTLPVSGPVYADTQTLPCSLRMTLPFDGSQVRPSLFWTILFGTDPPRPRRQLNPGLLGSEDTELNSRHRGSIRSRRLNCAWCPPNPCMGDFPVLDG